jgi:hypothetical protein
MPAPPISSTERPRLQLGHDSLRLRGVAQATSYSCRRLDRVRDVFLHKVCVDGSIADTIVPWTAEWLVHYEIWLVTGEWYGGGTGRRGVP